MIPNKPLLVLIAGPFRSGTDNDPVLIARNLERLESYSLPIYNAGHIPLIGEWLSLPMIREEGSSSLSDRISEKYLYPVANRLLERCDAVLRVEGPSKGADADVQIARERGLPVYYRVEDLPVLTSAN
jgi:hypothetical protein